MEKAMCAYTLNRAFGTNNEGDVVHMEQTEAQPLMDAGIISEAKEEDLNKPEEDATPEEDVAPEQNATLTRAVNRISRTIENSIAESVAKTFANTNKSKAPALTVPAEPKQDVYKCMGEMLKDVWLATKGDHRASNRLFAWRQKNPLGSNEGSNSQGGYAVKPEWADKIWDKARDYPRLLDRTERIPISGDTLNIPSLLETSLADGSRHGGVLGYWLAEGAPATSSYPALTQTQCVIQTNVVFAYSTIQLLQDSNIEPFDRFIAKYAGLELVWQENQAVTQGAGTTQPVGILNQPALITVTKSSNDSAAMFGMDDLAKMVRSLYRPCRKRAVFLVTPEAYAVLQQMAYVNVAGTVTTYPAYGLTFNFADEIPLRYGGIGMIEWEGLPQLGNVGDIILADLSQLVTAEKPMLYADVSNDYAFNTLQVSYRFYRRYDIRSPWTAPLSAPDNHYSYSPFIALQSRGT